MHQGTCHGPSTGSGRTDRSGLRANGPVWAQDLELPFGLSLPQPSRESPFGLSLSRPSRESPFVLSLSKPLRKLPFGLSLSKPSHETLDNG